MNYDREEAGRMQDATEELIRMRQPGGGTMIETHGKPISEIVPAPNQIEASSLTPMAMLERAITSGASIEIMERLMSLQERWEAKQARRAFDEAMANAKAEIPTITKNRVVDFTSERTKQRTNYRYEDLESVASTVGPALSKFGLSYRYRATSNPNEPVTVTCIVSHRAGHFEELTLAAGRDDSGNKNSIQAISSTMTYLQRISLKAALGLAVSNDDDGQTSEEKPKDNSPPRHPNAPPKEDPISSGPPRTAPKPDPKQKSVAPQDISQAPQPHKIPSENHTFESWAEKYTDLLKTSPVVATAYAWIDQNNDSLGLIDRKKPSVSAEIKKATEQVMAMLRKAAEKEAPKSDVVDPAAGVRPDYNADPDAFVRWAGNLLKTSSDENVLENLYTMQIEPFIPDGAFPTDRDLIIEEYRRQERRFVPDAD